MSSLSNKISNTGDVPWRMRAHTQLWTHASLLSLLTKPMAVLPLQRFSNVPVTYRGKCSLEDLWELCTRRRVEAYNSRWHASSEEAPALCISAKLYTITDKQLLHLSGSNVVFWEYRSPLISVNPIEGWQSRSVVVEWWPGGAIVPNF